MDYIKNVKISHILASKSQSSTFIETTKRRMATFKQKRNIFIIKDIFPITISKKSEKEYHLNVTGIKSPNFVPNAIKWIFATYCNKKVFKLLYYKVDKITACFDLGYTVLLHNLALQIRSSKYNPERFHALYFKNEKGTTVVFSPEKS